MSMALRHGPVNGPMRFAPNDSSEMLMRLLADDIARMRRQLDRAIDRSFDRLERELIAAGVIDDDEDEGP